MTPEPLEGCSHLLVIEDNPADVDLLRRALTSAGVDCRLTVIDDGAEAMAFVRSASPGPQPDLAIVDLNLPKHGGLEIIEQMRAHGPFTDLAVVILSSSSARRDRTKLERLRVKRYIVKPPDLEEFMRIGWYIREVLLEGRTRERHSVPGEPRDS